MGHWSDGLLSLLQRDLCGGATERLALLFCSSMVICVDGQLGDWVCAWVCAWMCEWDVCVGGRACVWVDGLVGG